MVSEENESYISFQVSGKGLSFEEIPTNGPKTVDEKLK
jgi:hypothetical protein